MYQGKTGKGGYITVIFHQANNCIAKDLTNTSDVYAIVGLIDKTKGTIDRSKPTASTPVIYSTLNPVWHFYQECGPFEELDPNTEIIVALYDVDLSGPDELMGSTVVTLKKIPPTFETAALELTLEGQFGGQLLVEWCYRPHGNGEGDIPDEWLLPRHERPKWKNVLERAKMCLASAQANALSLLPPFVTQKALSGDEDVLKDLPVKKSIVRVFTSSTFTDTKLERNMLMRDVYPFLSRMCRKLGLTFEVVDMRWGVREATNDSHNTSTLCMKELQKCLNNSLGPAFVCFLGEKYGYRPFPARIPANYMAKMWPYIRQAELEFAEEFMKNQKIKWNLIRINTKDSVSPAELWDNLGANKTYAKENDIFLVPTWFKLDTNAPNGGEYALINITDLIPEFRSNDQATARAASSRWWKIFERMQKTLRDASKLAFKDTHPFGTTYSPTLEREVHFSDRFTISVTHEEVVNGILHNQNRDKQSYCFRSSIEGIENPEWNPNKPKFIDGSSKDGQMCVDSDARGLLQNLKGNGVPGILSPSRIFDRKITPDELYLGVTSDELNRLETFDSHPSRREFCDHFCEIISNDILESFSDASNQVAMDPIVSEIRPHLLFQNSKNSSYVSRPTLEQQVMNYIKQETTIEGMKSNQFPLVLLGSSGSGKSTLMARCASLTKKSSENAVVISRYIGTTPGSTQLASLLRSICMQLFLLYGNEKKVKEIKQEVIEKEEDPTKLGGILLQCLLSFPSPSRPLYLFLDSLDQLFDTYKLAWIPVRVENSNVRIVFSLLDTSVDNDGTSNLESIKLIHPCAVFSTRDWIVDVVNFTLPEAKQLFKKEMKGRDLTGEQTKELNECIAKAPSPTPLFVKMLSEFAQTWRSFSPPSVTTERLPNIKESKDLVTLLFQYLETIHGKILVSHAMRYLTASKIGLSGSEMEDLLSCDEEVLSDVYQWWTPPIRRIPPLLWKRVIEDLGTNLVEYAVDEGGQGPTVYKWYHKQFSEVCQERYLAYPETKLKYHNILANYFEGIYSSPAEIPFTSKPDNKQQLADRMVPPQPLLFSSSTFNSRKLSELPFHHLFGSFSLRLFNSLLSFEFIEAKCGAGMIHELKNDYKVAVEVLEQRKDPLAPTMKEFKEFIFRYSHILGAIYKEKHSSYQFHLQALQLALNLPDNSAVYFLAKKQWDENYCHNWKTPLLKKTKATKRDPCLFTYSSHTKAITTLAVAPNESRVISCEKSKFVKCWDPKKGIETFTLLSKFPATACYITKDSTKVVIGYRYPVDPIKIVHLHNGQELKQLNGSHESQVNDIWMSKDEKKIVSCSDDKKMIIWDTESGNPFVTCEGHTGTVDKLCVNESETKIVTASSDQTLKVWNFLGELVHTITHHSGPVYSCKFKSEVQLMSCSGDKTVRIWDANDFSEISRFEYPGEVFDFCISSDGNKLVTLGSDKLVNVRDFKTGTQISNFVGHMMKIVVCVPMQNNRVITGSHDRTVKIWDLDAETNTQINSTRDNIFKLAHSRSVYFRMSEDKTTIEVMDFEKNEKRSEIKFPTTEGKKELVMDISRDGEILVSIIKPVVLHLWDTNTGEIVKKIPISEEFHTCKISNDKKQMIALAKKKLYFINCETGVIEREIEGHNNTVACCFSEDQQYVPVVYFGDSAIKVYKISTGELICTLLGHTNPPRSIVMSANGKVVSGGPDKTLRIWDGINGKEIKNIPQVDWVWDLAISGKFILVNNRVAVGLWNLDTLQLVGLINAFQLPFSELHLYDDSREVLAVTNKELHWFTF